MRVAEGAEGGGDGEGGSFDEGEGDVAGVVGGRAGEEGKSLGAEGRGKGEQPLEEWSVGYEGRHGFVYSRSDCAISILVLTTSTFRK